MAMLQLTLHNLQQMMAIVKHRLDDELEIQGEIAFHIGLEVARQEGVVRAVQEELSTLEAELTIETKRRYDKATVAEIQAAIQLNSRRQALVAAVSTAQVECKRWAAVQDAWKQRGHALTNLAKLHSTDYFSQRSTSVGGDEHRAGRNNAVDQQMEDRRAALRTAVGSVDSSRARVRVSAL